MLSYQSWFVLDLGVITDLLVPDVAAEGGDIGVCIFK